MLKKTKKVINLPESLEPYQAIRNWKINNNFDNYEEEYSQAIKRCPILIETNYKKINISFSVNTVYHLFETDNKFYSLSCTNVSLKIADLARDYLE
ncbi:hypothetical protein PSOL_06200 [Candidatus Phytoplasma solani]|uniref:hypothetical protein n=1 Tax=Candidatus Phytoplasma solani TaxID=69896 RepID=UPI0032DAA140